MYLDSQDTMNYAISRAGWIADYTDPNTFMDMWITGGGNNDTGWSSPDYDRLLQESFAAPDEAARMAIYTKMETILMDEVPIMPVYFYTRPYAVNPKVRWVPNVIDNRNWKFVDIAP